jgi:predicted transcriptional regulator
MTSVRSDKSESVKKALEEALKASGNADADQYVQKVLEVLDNEKVFRYHNENTVNLLSTAGRVLVAILEDPTMTQRAIAVYLNLSETMIDRTIKTLTEKGLITKTKLQRQNVYKVNIEEIKNHPDIRHFSGVIQVISEKKNAKTVTKNLDEEPF